MEDTPQFVHPPSEFYEEGHRRFMEEVDTFDKQQVEAGTVLIRAGETSPICLLHDGLAKAQTANVPHLKLNKSTLTIFGSYMWLGLELIERREAENDYVTMSDCVVSYVSVGDLMTKHSSILGLSMGSQYYIFYRDANWLQLVHKHGLRYRVLFVLWSIRARTNMIEIPITQTDIASMIGGDATRVSTVLSDLEKEGLIEKGYKSYVLPGLDVLYKACRQLVDPNLEI